MTKMFFPELGDTMFDGPTTLEPILAEHPFFVATGALYAAAAGFYAAAWAGRAGAGPGGLSVPGRRSGHRGSRRCGAR